MTPGGGGRRPRSGGHRIPPGSGHVERTRASKPPSISSARIPRATRVAGTARHTATAAPHPPKEGLHLTHPPGHGLHRGVGQIRLHRPPDPLHRVVVETRARTEDEPDPGVLPKPAGDHPGAMDGHVVEEEGDGRDRGVGGQHPLQEPKEAGAGGPGGDRRWLVPGVGTRIRGPVATQVERNQGRRWRWASSSASRPSPGGARRSPVASAPAPPTRWDRPWPPGAVGASWPPPGPGDGRPGPTSEDASAAGAGPRWGPHRDGFRWGPLPSPGLGQPASDARLEPRAAQPGPPRAGRSLSPAMPSWLRRWIQRRTVEGSSSKSSATVAAG